MRDLQAIAHECLTLVDALHIPRAKEMTFAWNPRLKRLWGRCKFTVQQKYIIELNCVFQDESTDISGLKNTLLHEILHTCEGCMNHGAQWKAYAKQMQDAYGIVLKRTGSAWEKGIAGTAQPPIHKTRRVRRYTRKAIQGLEQTYRKAGLEFAVLQTETDGQPKLAIAHGKNVYTCICTRTEDGTYSIRKYKSMPEKYKKLLHDRKKYK